MLVTGSRLYLISGAAMGEYIMIYMTEHMLDILVQLFDDLELEQVI